ncbi:polyprenyl synthetase family protein [Chloroflexota bacterium]
MQSYSFAPVESELALVEENLKAIAAVEYPWLAELLSYILASGGKRIRPALTLLAGNFHSYNLNLLIPMATGIELLHTATLIHDDTIDSSLMRRGKPTTTSIWGGGIATLTGDYLFAKAAELVSGTGNTRATMLFSQTLVTICNGELEQSFTSFRDDQNRESYFRRIGNKTASLFSTATESAGILSEAPEEMVQALQRYGYALGIAFQIVDDILDFVGQDEELGKPAGSDLLQGTMTLPALLLQEQHPDDNPITGIFKDEDKEQNLKLAIDMICNSEIISESYHIAQSFASRAKQSLELLPPNLCGRTLLELADYVVERKK